MYASSVLTARSYSIYMYRCVYLRIYIDFQLAHRWTRAKKSTHTMLVIRFNQIKCCWRCRDTINGITFASEKEFILMAPARISPRTSYIHQNIEGENRNEQTSNFAGIGFTIVTIIITVVFIIGVIHMTHCTTTLHRQCYTHKERHSNQVRFQIKVTAFNLLFIGSISSCRSSFDKCVLCPEERTACAPLTTQHAPHRHTATISNGILFEQTKLGISIRDEQERVATTNTK